DRSRSVVGGFSQGGALALALALRRSERARPAGVLAFSAYLPDVDGVELDWDAAPSIPVLVQHGTDDPLIPVDVGGRALARTLMDHGVPTTYSEFPMGHSVAMAGLEEAHAWLLAVLRRPCDNGPHIVWSAATCSDGDRARGAVGEVTDDRGGERAVARERGDERVDGFGGDREQQPARGLRVGEQQLFRLGKRAP